MLRHLLFVVSLIGSLAAPSTARAGFDAAADFSPTSNPNGVWSYGWTQALGSSFIADAIHESEAGLDFWEGSIANGATPGSFPLVVHNGTANTIITAGTVSVAPGQLALHPGPDNEYSVLRWTAPRNDAVSIRSVFDGFDFVGPTSTDVHVLHNGSSLFDDDVHGQAVQPGAERRFAAELSQLLPGAHEDVLRHLVRFVVAEHAPGKVMDAVDVRAIEPLEGRGVSACRQRDVGIDARLNRGFAADRHHDN